MRLRGLHEKVDLVDLSKVTVGTNVISHRVLMIHIWLDERLRGKVSCVL